MITLNGKTFAPLGSAAGENVGFYKVLKNDIKLYNIEKQEIGGINRGGVLYKTTILDDGGKWFSYGDIKEIGEFPTYRAAKEEIDALIFKHILKL